MEAVLLLAFSSEAFVSKVLPSIPWFSALKALVSVLVCIRSTGASFEMLERPEIKAWAVRFSDEVFSDEFCTLDSSRVGSISLTTCVSCGTAASSGTNVSCVTSAGCATSARRV